MTRRGLWMTTVLAGAFAPTLAWAQRDPDFYGHPMMWGGWYGMLFGPLMMILFIAAVTVLLLLAVRWFGGPGVHPHGPPDAEFVLDPCRAETVSWKQPQRQHFFAAIASRNSASISATSLSALVIVTPPCQPSF